MRKPYLISHPNIPSEEHQGRLGLCVLQQFVSSLFTICRSYYFILGNRKHLLNPEASARRATFKLATSIQIELIRQKEC